MTARRITCARCPRYDSAVRRCQDGKANPRSKSDSIAVAELLGARALCYQNPYRDALALRMHFPHEAAARQRSLLRNQRERIEIEIEQEAGEKEE